VIAVLDYGAGNVGSVLKAVEYCKFAARPAAQPELLAGAEKIILPGQGHFGAMIEALKRRRLWPVLRKTLEDGVPFLGICLGLQMLYEASEEAPGIAGLGLLAGKVKRFEGVFKVPHLGWSQLEIRRDDGLFRGIAQGSFVYYCHSYYGPVTPEASAITEYGQTFAAGLEIKLPWRVYAVQFHPEKSGEVGLRVLKNFLEL